MILKDMFAKPIDRDIKGVIKVGQDDNSNIKQELEEYVVTRELQKHFAEFFASYKRGFLSNKSDLEKLKSEDYQSQMAFAIASGIMDFYTKE